MEDEGEMEVGSWDSSAMDDCTPRIGREYQVAIPVLLTHRFFGAANAHQNGSLMAMDEIEEAYATGRAVKVTSIQMSNDRKQEGVNPCTSDQGCGEDRDEAVGIECIEDADSKEVSRNGTDATIRRRRGKKKRRGNWNNLRRMRAKNSSDQLPRVIVPGDSFVPWNECEQAAFVLGLYLFGKDFNALKRFLEAKEIKDLQHYYYSKFYGTAPYKRWFAARNNGSKRIVNGQQILVGWRQEELLRRLLPELEECSRPEIFEAMAGFNKGELSFESFVSRVKAVAGLELLIDSVGLGCGKRDLTMGSADSAQSSKKWELPPGKAFSDYTASEMSRALSGGCRLSKTRAQDLFWEAIWPRLLAKGWSSEQTGSKGPLAYMVPGIKRYSKRSLVKGRDYFDSISEVLNHLASNPTLLELPELDNELLAKSQPDKRQNNNAMQSNSRERHRPTLWLSKGTSHAFVGCPSKEEDNTEPDDSKDVKREQDDNKDLKGEEDAKDLKEEEDAKDLKGEEDADDSEDVTRGPDDRNDANMPVFPQMEVDCRSLDHTTLMRAPAQLELGSAFSCDLKPHERVISSVLTSFRGKGYEVMPRKRSFYDAFPESNVSAALQAGVAVTISPQPGRKPFSLDSMIKQYLGNGKSMRLYGPAKLFPSSKSTQRQETYAAYEVFLKRFQEALCRDQNRVFDLLPELGAGKSDFPASWQLDNSRTLRENEACMPRPEKLCKLELLEKSTADEIPLSSGCCCTASSENESGAFLCNGDAEARLCDGLQEEAAQKEQVKATEDVEGSVLVPLQGRLLALHNCSGKTYSAACQQRCRFHPTPHESSYEMQRGASIDSREYGKQADTRWTACDSGVSMNPSLDKKHTSSRDGDNSSSNSSRTLDSRWHVGRLL